MWVFEEPLASAPRLLKAAAPGELWGTRASLTRSLPSHPEWHSRAQVCLVPTLGAFFSMRWTEHP